MRTLFILSVVLLFMVSNANAGPPYTCVGNDYGVTFNPGSFQTGWSYTNTLEVDRVMQNDAGFTVSFHINFDVPESNPDPGIGTYLSEMDANAGGIFIFTHGNSLGQVVAYYAYTTAGKANRDADYAVWSASYGIAVYPSESAGSYYAVGFRYAFLSFALGGWGDMANGFFHNACCEGDQFTQLGGGDAGRKPDAATGEVGCPSVSTVYANVNTVWGIVASDDLYWRSFENGIQDAANLSLIGSGTIEGLALFPKVMGFSHRSGTRVPLNGLIVTMETDTRMNTVTLPATFVATSSGDISVYDAWYSGDTEIKARLEPDAPDINGEGYLDIGGWSAHTSAVVLLEGGDTQSFRFIVGDGPAAEVTGFWVDNGLATFEVSSEYRTKHYLIEEATSSLGPWTTVGIPEPPHVGTHSIGVAGKGPLVRLVEVEEDTPTGKPGKRLVHKHGRVGPKPVIIPRIKLSLEARKRKVADLRAEMTEQMSLQQGALSLPGEGQRGVIWTPGYALPYVELYLADPVRLFLGYTVSVVSVDTYAALGSDSLFAGALKGAMADSANAGAFFHWHIGDAGDRQHTQVWPDSAWEVTRQQQLGWGYDPTGRIGDIEIPLFIRWDLDPRDVSVYFHAPYGKTDLPYANVDNDELGIRDIYLARLPFADESRIVNYSYHMLQGMTGFTGIGNALFLDHDVDYGHSSGDGARADSIVTNILAPLVPADGSVTILRMSEILDNLEDVNIRVANEINGLMPNYLGGASPLSHENFWMNMIDKTITPPWDMSLLYYVVSLVDMPSCGTAGFWRNGILANGDGLATDWLGAYQMVGATNIKGYGDGTWQRVDAKEDEYFLQEIAADPSQPACVASTKASNRMRIDFADKLEFLVIDETKFFLGNPFTPISKMSIATGIGDIPKPKELELNQNYPNPFNPTTTISYELTKTGSVSIRIYNVLGQLVKTLIDEVKPAGYYTITWDGDNNRGRQVASGAYFYRLSAEKRYLTKKMLLLK